MLIDNDANINKGDKVCVVGGVCVWGVCGMGDGEGGLSRDWRVCVSVCQDHPHCHPPRLRFQRVNCVIGRVGRCSPALFPRECVRVRDPPRRSPISRSDPRAYAMRLVTMQWFDTALHHVRSVNAVKMLLEKGADINGTDWVCVVGRDGVGVCM